MVFTRARARARAQSHTALDAADGHAPAPPMPSAPPPALAADTPPPHGLAYPSSFLRALPVFGARPAPHTPVRALSAAQFADLHTEHALAHASDGVLFPFLHGLEGENAMQNAFFAATSADARGHLRVPDFRGLVWVVADEDAEDTELSDGSSGASTPPSADDDDDGPDTSDDDLLDDDDDDDDAPATPACTAPLGDDDAFGMPMDVDVDAADPNALPHMHPVHIRKAGAGPGTDILDYTAGAQGERDRRPSVSTASESSYTDSIFTDDDADGDASHARTLSISTAASTSPAPHSPPAKSAALAARPRTPAPARPFPLFTSTFRPHELLRRGADGKLDGAFLPPRVPDGISLRNFGIQMPVYATLSDIVVYSVRGDTRAALQLAHKLKLAVERVAAERAARKHLPDAHAPVLSDAQHDAAGGVRYNVFVLDAAPTEVRTVCGHLLKRVVDEHGHDTGCTAGGEALKDLPAVEGLDTVASTQPCAGGSSGLGLARTTSCGPSCVGTLRANTIDFAQREKEEMRELTRASEIHTVFPAAAAAAASPDARDEVSATTTATHWDPALGQLFLGNQSDVPTADAPLARAPSVSDGSPLSCSSSLSALPRPGCRAPALAPEPDEFAHGANDPAAGRGFDVCIECHDMAPFPGAAHLRAADEHVRLLDRLWADKCAREGRPADSVRPPPGPGAVIHLPFPSSPPNTGVTVAAILPIVAFLERAMAPADGAAFHPRAPVPAFNAGADSAAAEPVRRTRPLKVLIYSADGYTESSVLALALLMALRGLALPEAYLALQVEKRRSFFVYAADLGVLRRTESRVARALAANGSPRRQSVSAAAAEASWGAGTASRSSPRPIAGAAARGQPSTVSYAASAAFRAAMAAQQPASTGAPGTAATLPVRRPRASTSPMLPTVFGDHQAWFDDPRFDGSFPSRVLPFLYLGNLQHASNAYMLHALGITHVVSVGECALVPPPRANGGGPGAASPHASGCHGNLWIEEREGRMKVLDIKGVCDDGIDTLEPQLAPVCAWIDRARADGGHVLVHCRVGVSRSATVVIAYVMQHLGLSLVDAYLVVRSRRLSVLIQPNMRLLYNLLGWEIKLARERAQGDPARLREELARQLNWPYLAKEVHKLNEKYLV